MTSVADGERVLGAAQIAAASCRMLTRRERLNVGALAVVMAVNGALQSFSLAALLPVIGLMLDPAAASRHGYVAKLSAFLGHPEPTRLLIICVVGVLAVIILKNVVDLVYNYSLNRLVAGVERRVAVGLLRECMDAPYTWFLSKNSAVLVKQVMGDVVIWARSGLSSALSFISSAITLGAVLTLLISLNVLFGFGLAVVGALVSLAIIKILKPYIRRTGARKHEGATEAVKIINHALTGAKDIKVHGTQHFFVDQFDRAYGVIGANSARLGTVNPVPGQVIEIGIGLIIVLTAIYVALNSTMRAELLSALAVYGVAVIRALPVFNQISSTFGSIQAAAPAIAGIQRLQAELAAAPAPQGAISGRSIPPAWDRIEVQRLSYRYPGSAGLALHDVSFVIERGARIGIVGASGSGKTTLVDVLTGLLTPTSGRVLIGGQALTPESAASWQQQIGYVSQHPFIADESLRFNVALGVERERVDDARVRDVLEAASFGEVLRTELPAGLDSELGERGVRLSGGQRQRVAIARALYREASVLVLDEATSALDSENERLVSLALARIPRKTTMLIVAHRLSTVKDCDRILVLDRGLVIAYDTHATLIRECALYRRFVELGDLSLAEADDLQSQAATEGRA